MNFEMDAPCTRHIKTLGCHLMLSTPTVLHCPTFAVLRLHRGLPRKEKRHDLRVAKLRCQVQRGPTDAAACEGAAVDGRGVQAHEAAHRGDVAALRRTADPGDAASVLPSERAEVNLEPLESCAHHM